MNKIAIFVSSLLFAASVSAFTTSQTYLKLDDGASFGKQCAPEGVQSIDKSRNTLSCEKNNWNFSDKNDYSFITQNNSVTSANQDDYIKINSFSEPGKGCNPNHLLSRDKNENYITCRNNKWKEKNPTDELSQYQVSVFIKDAKQKSLVSGTGIYDKSSDLVNLMPNNKYFINSHADMDTQKNKDNVFFVGREIAYKKASKTEKNTDGTSTTSQSIGVLNEGFSVNIKPDDKNSNIDIKQENLVSMKTFLAGNGDEIELPNIQKWHTELKFLPENKIARFDSPVFEKNGRQYQSIYLIEKNNDIFLNIIN